MKRAMSCTGTISSNGEMAENQPLYIQRKRLVILRRLRQRE